MPAPLSLDPGVGLATGRGEFLICSRYEKIGLDAKNGSEAYTDDDRESELNPDFSRRVVVSPASLDWQLSPEPENVGVDRIEHSKKSREALVMRNFTGVLVLALLAALTRPASAEVDLIENAFGMKFVYIPAGNFDMGTADTTVVVREMEEPDTNAFKDENPAHKVTISRSFLLSQTEVTQRQWLTVMENRPGPGENWQRKDWERLPVVSVSWLMAQRFAEELSSMDQDYRYRLPTEAEWEYAARAGNGGIRPIPTQALTDYAWFIANSGDAPHPVATRKPNAWGLHDMLGNVWEWVADWYAPNTYADGVQRTDPVGPVSGRSRVRRGGSFHCPLYQTRPGFREANTPETTYSVMGFRLVAEKRH